MIQGLATEFTAEIKTKQEALGSSQAQVRVTTRELAEQRKQIQIWQAQCAELDLVMQRTKNLQKALEDEENFDWTGRTNLDGSETPKGPFQKRTPTLSGSSSLDISLNLDEEPTIPMSDSVTSLIRLRRLKMWHERVESLMEERLQKLQGASAEREFQCKKIVSLCTNVPIDKIEDVGDLIFLISLPIFRLYLLQMLDNLVIAMESDAHIVDISRVSGFMQKVRHGPLA